MAYRLSRRAEADFSGIYVRGVIEFGRAQSEAYVASLRQTLAFLADNPRAARPRPELRHDMRLYPFEAHVIAYRIEGHGILIVRILHARQDLPKKL